MLTASELTLNQGNKTLCASVHLNMKAGEVWGVLGPNGCGKTSLLHALCGLRPVTRGEIQLNHQPLTRLPTKAIARQIGILLQDFHPVFPQSVRDYCRAARYPHLPFLKRETRADFKIVIKALRDMELLSFSRRSALQLSGGEQRRLAIAALLVQTPAIYLLDEPTNHLDVRHQHLVLRHFRRLADSGRATVMMSLHDASLAEHYCDYVLLMFPHGDTLQGRTRDVLTHDHLTRLYQHPIDSIHHGNMLYWQPRPGCAAFPDRIAHHPRMETGTGQVTQDNLHESHKNSGKWRVWTHGSNDSQSSQR